MIGKFEVFLIYMGNELCLWMCFVCGGGGGCGLCGIYFVGCKVIGSFSDEDGLSLIVFVFLDGV